MAASFRFGDAPPAPAPPAIMFRFEDAPKPDVVDSMYAAVEQNSSDCHETIMHAYTQAFVSAPPLPSSDPPDLRWMGVGGTGSSEDHRQRLINFYQEVHRAISELACYH